MEKELHIVRDLAIAKTAVCFVKELIPKIDAAILQVSNHIKITQNQDKDAAKGVARNYVYTQLFSDENKQTQQMLKMLDSALRNNAWLQYLTYRNYDEYSCTVWDFLLEEKRHELQSDILSLSNVLTKLNNDWEPIKAKLYNQHTSPRTWLLTTSFLKHLLNSMIFFENSRSVTDKQTCASLIASACTRSLNATITSRWNLYLTQNRFIIEDHEQKDTCLIAKRFLTNYILAIEQECAAQSKQETVVPLEIKNIIQKYIKN